MNIAESFKIAIKCIRANWMRSLLTMLGIIIGISSVIMIVGAGTGARDYIVSLIEEMGANAIMISVDATKATDNEYLTLDDVENIKNKIDSVESCSPMLMGFGNATIDSSAKNATAMIIGVNTDVQLAMPDGCSYGRFFTDEEYQANSPVAIIGSASAQTVFGYEDVTGESITIRSSGKAMKVRVCGVANIDQLAGSVGGSSAFTSMFQQNEDSLIIALFMPCTTLTQITGADTKLSSAFVFAKEGEDNDAVGNAVVNYLKAAHGNYSNSLYVAQNMATYIEIVDIVMQVLTAFIACVGAISLIVGGIGVMNIMLVSVTERTREIGIRKSLGAKTRVITMQFLTESIIICLIGGIIGLTLGILGAYGACAIVGISPKITWWVILLALFFSSGVGLFFGIYPARKAALMSPIDALRRD
ncbi:MAG: FtsX-like permease family protein [Eubacterium sp.]|nr:FtsX-like permease family protein [Eubacterium sp.]